MSYRRQISSEQELWQERYKDYLWLELQMEKNGFQNQLEQEEFLQNERAKIPGVIEEILNFRFECSVELSDSKSEEDSYANRQNEGTAYSFTLSSETVAQQREALKYVQELLDKLDSCEKLFPTSRKYVDKTLKRMGMNKMLLRFKELLDRTLQRAREALQRPKTLPQLEMQSPEVDGTVQLSSSPSLDLHYADASSTSINFHRSSSLTDFGAWCEQFIQMGLPSFQSSYLFLLHVFLEVIHEALRLRLEQRPLIDPSFLSIRPLLRECKEVSRGAVIVKQYFQTMVDEVTSEGDTNTMKDLEEFDNNVRQMLEVYFIYLQSWMLALQSLPEASLSLKNVLESEWLFTKQICPHVIGGEAEAGKRFSSLASSLLNSIADFLESGIDDFSTSLYNLTINDDSVDRSDPREKDTNKNNDSDTNDEVQDQQKMVIQDISAQRKEFESLMGKTVRLVNEQTSCHQAIAESLTELKVEGLLLVVIHSSQLSAQRKEFESLMGKTSSAMELQERVVQAIKQVDDKFYCKDMANFDDNERNHLLNLYRETILRGCNFGFEYLREMTRQHQTEAEQTTH
uniref:Mitogen-activated protein kinase kinase kinase 4 n=1 Tax=Magallana gigas TaxID=29159 RepID=K1R1Y1_MAGGI